MENTELKALYEKVSSGLDKRYVAYNNGGKESLYLCRIVNVISLIEGKSYLKEHFLKCLNAILETDIDLINPKDIDMLKAHIDKGVLDKYSVWNFNEYEKRKEFIERIISRL